MKFGCKSRPAICTYNAVCGRDDLACVLPHLSESNLELLLSNFLFAYSLLVPPPHLPPQHEEENEFVTKSIGYKSKILPKKDSMFFNLAKIGEFASAI